MQRKPLYLAVSVAETARFLALSFLASALGGLREGDGLPALFRYAAAPQLLFAAAFFFLWLDGPRYAAYARLVVLGKVLSLAAYVPLFLSITFGGSALFLDRTGPSAALVSVAVDLLGLVVALLVKVPADRPEAREPVGPTGPGDIEKVED